MTPPAAPACENRLLDFDLLSDGDYRIRAIERDDMLPIMHWRNAQLDVLRQAEPLTEERQFAYWDEVVEPGLRARRPAQLLFTLLCEGKRIGYGGLVHIAWADRRAEVSFLVDPRRAADPSVYARDFTTWLRLIRRIAFDQLGFQRLFTETYDIRPAHVALLEAAGFVLEGRLRRHVIIQGRPVDSLIHGCLNPDSFYSS